MFAQLKKMFKKTPLHPSLREAGFEVVIGGKKKAVYEFKDTLTIATGRYLVFLQYCNEMAQNADRDFLKESLTAIQKDILTNKAAQAIGKMTLLMETLDNYTPMEQYLNVATVFFVVEGEDCESYDYELAEQKKEAFSQLENKVFFWQRLGTALTKQGLYSKEDTLSYLEAQKSQKQREVLYKVITDS
jgi:hypothetical protein